MSGSRFVYVTFIRTTPEKLWEALTKPEFTRKYWFGVTLDCTWKTGASWRMVFEDGSVADAGELLDCDPPRRMVINWRHEMRPELKAEGYSRCVMELEPLGDATKLTITHTMERGESKLIEAVSGGWPLILSNLKALLETGSVVMLEKKK